MLEAETHDSISHTSYLVSLFFFNIMGKIGLRNVISAGRKESGINSSYEHMKTCVTLETLM